MSAVDLVRHRIDEALRGPVVPLLRHTRGDVGIRGGKVAGLGAVAAHIVQLPGGAELRDQLPLAVAPRLIALLLPPYRQATYSTPALERPGETAALPQPTGRPGHTHAVFSATS